MSEPTLLSQVSQSSYKDAINKIASAVDECNSSAIEIEQLPIIGDTISVDANSYSDLVFYWEGTYVANYVNNGYKVLNVYPYCTSSGAVLPLNVINLRDTYCRIRAFNYTDENVDCKIYLMVLLIK